MNAPAHGIELGNRGAVETVLEIPLLGGTFRAEESRECVLQLLSDLQSYHSRRNLSHQERFGAPCPDSEKALAGIARAMDSARHWIDEAVDGTVALVLESSLSLTVAERAPAD